MNDLAGISINCSINQLQSMSLMVEKALERSILSLVNFDTVMAHNVISDDKAINAFEIAIDNSTFNIFATNNTEIPPDTLRKILSVQKINPMLERIADHAVNIAESAQTLSYYAKNCDLFELPQMTEHCKSILHDALKSFFNEDLTLAADVLGRDDVVDKLNVSTIAEVKACVLNEFTLSFETAVEIIRISRNLERIADLSSNIAEETMYSTAGKMVKHHAQAFESIYIDQISTTSNSLTQA